MERSAMSKVYPSNALVPFLGHNAVISAFFLVLVLFSAGLSAFPLIFTSDRQGELTTCGCSVDQLGGLARLPAALALRKLSTSDRLWVDGGDLFFPSLGLSPERLESEKPKARLLAKVYGSWGVSFLTPGPKDFAGGIATLKELQRLSGIRFLSANLRDLKGRLLYDAFALSEHEGVKVAVVGISGEALFEKVPEVTVSSASKALTNAVADAKARGAVYVVVVSQSGLTVDRELAKTKGIDLWVSGASIDGLANPLIVGETIVGQVLPLGQQVGIFHVSKKVGIRYEVVNVVQDLKEDQGIQRNVSAVSKRSKFLPDPKGKNETKPYVANFETCRGCHAKQVAFWESTKHASAYLVLYGKNQHFDRECITCHSLGFETDKNFAKIAHPIVLKQESSATGDLFVDKMMESIFASAKVAGPIDSREQPEAFAVLKKAYHASLAELQSKGKLERVFMGVQCEHCHDNRAGHPTVSRKPHKVSTSKCMECHHPPHHNNFSPELLSKISCPLIGS